MENNSDSVLEMYLYETNTLLEQLDNIMLSAEQADTLSEDDVNEIFRIMHTLKGSAAMMEFEPLMTIAHRIEDLFFLIRENTMGVVPEQDRPQLFDLLFKSIDYFRSEVSKIESGEPLSNNIDNFVNAINMFIDKINGQEVAAQEQADEPAEKVQGSGDPDHRFSLRVYLDDGCGMENLRAFMAITDVKDQCMDEFTYEPEGLEDNTALSETIIGGLGFVKTYQEIDYIPAEVETKPEPSAASAAPAQDEAKVSVAAPAPQAVAAHPAEPARTDNSGVQNTSSPHQIKQNLISVNLSKLDQLMAVVGEIVITEAMVTASPDLKGLDGVKLDNFNKSARQLRKLTDELQDISMSLRMVPVSGTFQKMRRIVRDMGQKLGRRANLTIIGEDTEIDKTIVDAISDPIMHIVRNSMDHGIEPDEQTRIAAGKNPEGEIILSAQNTGSEVIIRIEDDGAGVDSDAVLRKAISQGLASPDVDYSQKEILNFLMMPGFSTNTEVTEFSGRGVGMDVVKKNIEAVAGVVQMTSEFGKGSCTTLKIPLTTAIMDGMEVSVGDSIFTIPLQNIRQSFKASESDIIHDAMKGEMISKMDNFYPVLRLHELYGLEPKAETTDDGIFVWVETSENSYCLFVDELLGEQQVVIKPLPSYLNGFGIKDAGIVGCTILGDGNISLILDVGNILASSTGYTGY